MILNLINYSLDQKLLNYIIKSVEPKLIKINQEEKKFIIYLNEVKSSGKGRKNPSERRIQLSPRTKHQLIGFTAEDYQVVLLGYHKLTNTFTFWKYDSFIETNTMQSLYTRVQTLNKANKEGYDIYYYKRRDAFNRGIVDERNWAFSVNAFLFPLVLENYNKIFTREISKIFGKKIKNFNNPFSKDELIMTLSLYSKYPLGTVNKNDPELSEISSFCEKRARLMGFNPISQFYPESIANKFRNAHGIYLKIQNFKVNDPNYKKKGMTGGSQSKQQIIWDLYSNGNYLNKEKLLTDSKEIKNRILSGRIDILIGDTEVTKEVYKEAKTYTESPNILLDFDLKQSYTNRTINPDNFSDPIEACNARDRATRLHEEVLKKLARMCKRKNLPIKKSIHIDFYTEYQNRGKLFEIKTFNNSNFKQQIRHGIIQLKEYYFIYAKYSEEILKQTDLFLLLNDNPEKIIEEKQIRFLKDQNIRLCWPQNNKIVTFKKDKWSDTHPAIKWLL